MLLEAERSVAQRGFQESRAVKGAGSYGAKDVLYAHRIRQ